MFLRLGQKKTDGKIWLMLGEWSKGWLICPLLRNTIEMIKSLVLINYEDDSLGSLQAIRIMCYDVDYPVEFFPN